VFEDERVGGEPPAWRSRQPFDSGYEVGVYKRGDRCSDNPDIPFLVTGQGTPGAMELYG
jgi:hypothetical protein